MMPLDAFDTNASRTILTQV